MANAKSTKFTSDTAASTNTASADAAHADTTSTGTITLNHITKIEGHASLVLGIDKARVVKCELQASEGSRYFEGLLRERKVTEAFEITSRICGICSVSHVVCSITAAEKCLGIRPSKHTLELREAIMLGERVRSHIAHLFFLALPDYLGYDSAISMAREHGSKVSLALEIMNLGNRIVRTIGGRDMHPITLCIGGFTKIPTKDEMLNLKAELKSIRPKVVSAARILSRINYPLFSRKTQYASLQSHSHDYFHEYSAVGDAIKCGNTTFPSAKYQDYIGEYHQEYSTANFVVKDEREYMVGSLARMNNKETKDIERLSKDARNILKKFLLNNKKDKSLAAASRKKTVHTIFNEYNAYNPFLNNLCQAAELVESIDWLIKLCSEYKSDIKEEARQETPGRTTGKRRGIAVVEAPRGLLWHDYTINSEGIITNANIITPTAQNLKNMEDDIRAYVEFILKNNKNISKEELVLEIEKLIRAYDPCFSCATHFLRVKLEE